MILVRCSILGAAIVAIAGVTATLPDALACSCAPPPPAPQALQQSAAVFLGKVTAIDKPKRADAPLKVALEVERWWKGGDAKTVVVTTADNSAACGYGFQVGGQYLVYADGGKQGQPLNVTICSRTAEAKSAQAAGDLALLGRGTAPPAQ